MTNWKEVSKMYSDFMKGMIHEDEREREVKEEKMAKPDPNEEKVGVNKANNKAMKCEGTSIGYVWYDQCEKIDQFVERRRNAPPPIKKPAAPANDPQNIWIRTTGVCENLTVKDGSLVKTKPDPNDMWVPVTALTPKEREEIVKGNRRVVHFHENTSAVDPNTYPASTPELVAEAIKVGVGKINERRAIVLGEARAFVARLREWPVCGACRETMALDYVSLDNGRGHVYLKCGADLHRGVWMNEFDLSPKALRALEAAGGSVRA